MSEFKITGPGLYRTRDGRKVEIAGAVSAQTEIRYPWLGIFPCGDTGCWAATGRWSSQRESDRDLIAPWTEPKTGTVWVNVYVRDDGMPDGYAYRDRADADEGASDDRIACVSVNWTEGEGL